MGKQFAKPPPFSPKDIPPRPPAAWGPRVPVDQLPLWLKILTGVFAVVGVGSIIALVPVVLRLELAGAHRTSEQTTVTVEAPGNVPGGDTPRPPTEEAPGGTETTPTAVPPVETPDPSPSDDDTPTPSDVERPEKVAESVDPLRDLRARKGNLSIPGKNESGFGRSTRRIKLAEVYLNSPDECQLELLGGEEILGGKQRIRLTPAVADGDAATWTVTVETTSVTIPDATVGRFIIQGTDISFQWTDEARSTIGADLVRHCLLRVRAGGGEIVCRLTEPVRVPAGRLRQRADELSIQLEPLPRRLKRLNSDLVRALVLVSHSGAGISLEPVSLWCGEEFTINTTDLAPIDVEGDEIAEVRIELVVKFDLTAAEPLMCTWVVFPPFEDVLNRKRQRADSDDAAAVRFRSARDAFTARISSLERKLRNEKKLLRDAKSETERLKVRSETARRQARVINLEGVELERMIKQAEADADALERKVEDFKMMIDWWRAVSRHVDIVEKWVEFQAKVYLELNEHKVVLIEAVADES